MQLSLTLEALAAASALCAAYGAWVFVSSLAAAPTVLNRIEGTVATVQASTAVYSRSQVKLEIDGVHGEFRYLPDLPRFYYVAENMKPGVAVELQVEPEERQKLWGLKLGSESVLQPATAHEAQRRGGNWGLALAVAFLVSATWAAKFAHSVRRNEATSHAAT